MNLNLKKVKFFINFSNHIQSTCNVNFWTRTKLTPKTYYAHINFFFPVQLIQAGGFRPPSLCRRRFSDFDDPSSGTGGDAERLTCTSCGSTIFSDTRAGRGERTRTGGENEGSGGERARRGLALHARRGSRCRSLVLYHGENECPLNSSVASIYMSRVTRMCVSVCMHHSYGSKKTCRPPELAWWYCTVDLGPS
jgi:hypothetical protein